MRIFLFLLLPIMLFSNSLIKFSGEFTYELSFSLDESKSNYGIYNLNNEFSFPLYKSDSFFTLMVAKDKDSISISSVSFEDRIGMSGDEPVSIPEFSELIQILPVKYYQGQRYFPVRIYPLKIESGRLTVPLRIRLAFKSLRSANDGIDKDRKFEKTGKKQAKINSPYSDWFRFEINSNQVFKMTKSDAEKWDINVNDPEEIHFFGFNGQMIPFRTDIGYPVEAPELPVYISNHTSGDGWQSNEEIFLFARSLNFFHHDSVINTHIYQNHFYDKENYLWMAIDNSYAPPYIAINNASTPASSQDFATTYDHVEKDEVNRLKSGTTWFENARGLANSPLTLNLDINNELVCYDCPDPRINISLVLAGGNRYLYTDNNSFSHYFDVDFESNQVSTRIVNDFFVSNYRFAKINTFYGLSSQLQDPKIRLHYTPIPSSSDGSVSPEQGKFFFDFYELSYHIRLIDFTEQVYMGEDFDQSAKLFDFANIPDNAQLWNITFANKPIISTVIDDDNFIPGYYSDKINSFLYVTSANAPHLPNPVIINYSHTLRDPGIVSDLIIITPQAFYEKAVEYGENREQWSPGTFVTEVVAVENIYNEFNSGVKDPGAIRNYLKYCWEERISRPSYVLLMGDGNYDPKEIIFKNNDKDLIPTFQIDAAREVDSFTSDFYFADLNVTYNSYSYIEPEIPLGRLPVSSNSDIDRYIEKLQNFGQRSQSNGWEEDFLLIADDLTAGSSSSEYFHFEGAENIFRNIPEKFNVSKLYLENYPAVSGGIGRIKPTATEEFLSKVNQGQSIIIYIGHGSPDKWAHETLYDLKLHRDLIKNKFTNGLWMALSCDISKFDDPGRATMGEDLINRSQSGSMWVFASARLVLAYQNNELGARIVQWLLTKTTKYTVGEALTLAVQDYSTTNTLKYVLFGDPSLPLLEGRNPVTFTNSTELDTLNSLQKVNINGHLGSNPGDYSSFNGNAVLRVYDTEDSLQHPDRILGMKWYHVLGPSLYKGQLSVTNGEFSAQFIVPKSIKYSDRARGKIWLYAWEPESGTYATASLNNIVFSGSSSEIDDFDGPEISISIDEENFGVVGDLIPQSSDLIVYMTDSSGINVSGEAGHEIALWVDGENKIDLTDFFVYDANSAIQGKLAYSLAGLSEGKHEFVLKAWDNANNPNEYHFHFEIAQADEVTLQNVFNYPNPMQNETWFTCQTSVATGEIEINIYSLSGRKVKTIKNNFDQLDFQRVYWDGKDENGNNLANGTYLYRFHLTSGGVEKIKTEKLVILK